MKIAIIGGVAAGMSAAARARRLDEAAEIVVLEKGRVVEAGVHRDLLALGGIYASLVNPSIEKSGPQPL